MSNLSSLCMYCMHIIPIVWSVANKLILSSEFWVLILRSWWMVCLQSIESHRPGDWCSRWFYTLLQITYDACATLWKIIDLMRMGPGNLVGRHWTEYSAFIWHGRWVLSIPWFVVLLETCLSVPREAGTTCHQQRGILPSLGGAGQRSRLW